MPDRDLEHEELENQQRKAEQEAAQEDDSILDTAEKAIDPFAKLIVDEPADAEDVEARREENDADQRPA